jgi:hypothetical protein
MTYVHRVTFGDQYRRDAHPRVSWAHPDGWFEIEVVGIARDEDAAAIAREFAFDTLGCHWAFDYTPLAWEQDNVSRVTGQSERDRWYPLGVLARATLTADGHASWAVFREFRQMLVDVTPADKVGDENDGTVDTGP